MTYAAPRPASLPSRMFTELASKLPGLTSIDVFAGRHSRVRGSTDPAPPVRGVSLDSRAVRPGDVYAALPGLRMHGAAFATQAVAAGAVAVLTDQEGLAQMPELPAGTPVLVSRAPRADLARLAAWVYGDPSRRLDLLGVTGTNGKTTTAFLLDAGLRAAGRTTGLVGTVETRVAGERVPSVRTTPESPDLQALLATMVERGVSAAAMEVSSHALAQHRVDALYFAGAVFTNLSQDHLDFHPSMEDYFEAKASLFDPGRTRVSVVGADDEWGRRLAARVPGCVTFGLRPGVDWRAVDIVTTPRGSEFRLLGPNGADCSAWVSLPGAFNVTNALAALSLLASVGVPVGAAVAGIAALPGVPGRMERVEAGQPFLALVDYAHTPEAIRTLLATVRSLVPGRVAVVVGCGGDRDRGKRPLMGAAAADGSDAAVFTSDNPRSEDPAEIVAQMLAGVSKPALAHVVVELDRAAAVAAAVAAARPGDAVVVAGKGHETGQERAGVVTAFDDREVLAAAIAAAASPGSRSRDPGADGLGADGLGADGLGAGPAWRAAVAGGAGEW